MATAQPQPTPVVFGRPGVGWSSPELSAPVSAFPTAPSSFRPESVLWSLNPYRSNVENLNNEEKRLKEEQRREKELETTKNEHALVGVCPYKKERDNLETRLDTALLENKLLRKQLALYKAPQVSDFSYREIWTATDTFTRLIGEDGHCKTYKGVLRHTQVVIKVLNEYSSRGPLEYLQFLLEVDALRKTRHPNIVTLIGVCEDPYALIYEYLPNGSLEDWLACKDNTTPPLSWKTRIRIAAELCSALMFLHSSQPKRIIHGDLKPANILLDASLSCKLSNLRFYRTGSKGELSQKSDVYSFGVILLLLLTGKLGNREEVQNALDEGKLDVVLDTSAGQWPFVQAEELARLGLRCCEMQGEKRADLESDLWEVLEPIAKGLGVWSGLSSWASLGCDNYDQAPFCFICPISLEIMQDPRIATDGFTYEATALQTWLRGRKFSTSPMTNLKLKNRTLIPNRVLRSAIQEWLEQRDST